MRETRNQREVSKRAYLMELIDRERDRQLASLSARASDMNARAALLVAAAGISGALQWTEAGASLQSAAVSALVLATLCGLAALAPVVGGGLPINLLEEVAWHDTAANATRRLGRWKQDYLDEGETILTHKRWLLLAGFVAFALSLALTAVYIAA
ncbi:MAG: hypothetical protein KJ683_09870 [Actinobacteria bacterium]|nr:hypothetical protein [Actinomycetota bacterium]